MLDNLTVVELKAECKKQGIKGYSKLKKIELIELLKNPNKAKKVVVKKQNKQKIYVCVNSGAIESQTEKAVRVGHNWFPKSKIIMVNNHDDTNYCIFVELWLYKIKIGGYIDETFTLDDIKNFAKELNCNMYIAIGGEKIVLDSSVVKEKNKEHKKVEVKYFTFKNKDNQEMPCRIFTDSDGESFFQKFKFDFYTKKYEINFQDRTEKVENENNYILKNELIKINKNELEIILDAQAKKFHSRCYL